MQFKKKNIEGNILAYERKALYQKKPVIVYVILITYNSIILSVNSINTTIK